jgi:hypothetical protein
LNSGRLEKENQNAGFRAAINHFGSTGVPFFADENTLPCSVKDGSLASAAKFYSFFSPPNISLYYIFQFV